MPTYEYQCEACGHKFEKFQPITSAAVRTCPKCGKRKVKRLISVGGGMIFKGSGFYITDYRDSKYTDSQKADTASGSAEKSDSSTKPAETSSSDSSGKKESKSESKPETKSDSKPATESKPTSKPEAKTSKGKKRD